MATARIPNPTTTDPADAELDRAIREIYGEAMREPLPPELLVLVRKLAGKAG
ncbi:hypothetical protein [Roseomonas fluvialis]|uniref:Anti-sigma factor NepR domain-containing protein n=1 Tax=Roseomonas fluvialis TaxID=1750527 RepID=A0ABN6P6Y0_9PROT|nr:hypothetical protein [Roseomonas fluvialis]BDG74467.1 hypothetical protein Rmf_43960 [Roseomonas fluvialis]